MRRAPVLPRPVLHTAILAIGLLAGCAPAAEPPARLAPDAQAASTGFAPERPADGARSACTYAGWSAPQPLAGVPSGSIIRNASLALGGEHGYVVGNDIYLFDTLPSPPRPLIAVTTDGRDIGKPAGDFQFASPRAFVDGGTLHVLWAEPGEGARPLLREDWIRLIFDYASLWHAAYTRERGWTEPARVYAGSGISWHHGMADMVADPAAGLHGVVGDETRGALVYLGFSHGAWQSRPVPGIVRRPSYLAIAASGGRVYVAYVAADRSAPRDANSVFLVRSADGGRTWLPPRLISRSGANQATQIRAFAAPDGTVHLVWAQNLSGGLEPQVVRHVVSGDGGETWSPPDDVDFPDGLGTLKAAVDRCGGVHVIHEARADAGESEESRLWYARWAGGWSAPEQPFGDLNSIEADLETGSDGSPRLVWSVVHLAENVHESTFVPVISRLGVNP
jgi:hypothetical protein